VRPLVLLHGLMDVPATWDLVRPALERDRVVIAPALPGHLGGPPLSTRDVVDQLEEQLDAAGAGPADVVGNSLGGYLALRLAERGRAAAVVAFAPGGGWAPSDPARTEVLALQQRIQRSLRHVDIPATVETAAGRRRATRYLTVRYEHIPPDLLAEQLAGASACDLGPYVDRALADGWPLDAARIECPVRLVWGAADALLEWPSAAARYRRLFPHADWVVLDDVGHAPQLDVPTVTAELIRSFVA
jgi:pimeloyl-ACP methyl ester carboxylesterase